MAEERFCIHDVSESEHCPKCYETDHAQTQDWWDSTNEVARTRVMGALGPKEWFDLSDKEKHFATIVLDIYVKLDLTHGA